MFGDELSFTVSGDSRGGSDEASEVVFQNWPDN